jgi:hypothetical protein
MASAFGKAVQGGLVAAVLFSPATPAPAALGRDARPIAADRLRLKDGVPSGGEHDRHEALLGYPPRRQHGSCQ